MMRALRLSRGNSWADRIRIDACQRESATNVPLRCTGPKVKGYEVVADSPHFEKRLS
jgi:hypothetical protein